MRKTLLCLALAAVHGSAGAADWSIGVTSGPFGFGHFVERTLRASTDVGTSTSRVHLSAATRPGLAVDLERRLHERWAARLEVTGTEAPVAVRDEAGKAVPLDAGPIDIGTVTLPLVWRVNREGALRVDLFAGPAHALYHIRRRDPSSGALSLFEGTRTRWGAVAGIGLAWWLRPRYAIEGRATDIVTSSPFRRSDFPASTTSITIPKPHNIHVTAGIRYAF
ncbi:MAG TPA: hypothetical protein VFL80_07075 [Thermoanaerobaculia bacterium]|nr:hypothetical protein [Thermoanaerobaculia bacterium]